MDQIYEEPLKITPGCADASGRLGIYETFRAFMDMAAIHAKLIGVGFDDMAKRGLFWLTAKTKVIFYERPRMGELAILRTWPEAPERIRGCRSYELLRDGETLITGRTEWAVLNTETGRLAPMKDVYPKELELSRPAVFSEPFTRMSDEFSEEDRVRSYRVASTDIDVGRHMNNAAYVRVLIGAFSNAELEKMNICGMEVLFKAPCYEGDELSLFRRRTEDGFVMKLARGEETAILARIACG